MQIGAFVIDRGVGITVSRDLHRTPHTLGHDIHIPGGDLRDTSIHQRPEDCLGVFRARLRGPAKALGGVCSIVMRRDRVVGRV